MNPIEYLRALRRRWTIVVASGVLAVVAAGLLSLGNVGPATQSYEGKTMLLKIGWSGSPLDVISLDTVAALVTVGEVPERAAKKIGFEGNPSVLASQVSAEADEGGSGLLVVTGTSTKPQEAELLAETFAGELIGYLDEQKTELFLQETESVISEMEELRDQAAALERRIGNSQPEQEILLVAERDALIRRYGLMYERYRQLAADPTAAGSFSIIAHADSQPAASEGIQAPRTPVSWMVVAGVLGLLVGAGVALVLDRFDTRIRTREAAEKHFALPVLTEIPLMRRGLHEVSVTNRKSPSAESFRLLGTGLMHGLRPNGSDGIPDGQSKRGDRGTIVVTSAGPSEGKTTVVANLAATFGELGKKVLILSCDFRRPKVHRLLGVSNAEGLADALRDSNGGPVLAGHVHETSVPGVSMVPSGAAPDKPAELLGSGDMRRVLEEARQLADVVIVDTAPILVANDAMHLLTPPVRVLVVARAGKTDAEQAERTSELLERAGATVVGVALNGVTETMVARRYYRYYRYYDEGYDERRKGIPGLLRQSRGK